MRLVAQERVGPCKACETCSTSIRHHTEQSGGRFLVQKIEVQGS